jgi:site-specific DNA recombinase
MCSCCRRCSAAHLKEKYGVVLRSVTELISAAEERRMIIRRTLAGKREKASRGGFSGGAAPVGYERDREGGLAVVDKESRTV